MGSNAEVSDMRGLFSTVVLSIGRAILLLFSLLLILAYLGSSCSSLTHMWVMQILKFKMLVSFLFCEVVVFRVLHFYIFYKATDD